MHLPVGRWMTCLQGSQTYGERSVPVPEPDVVVIGAGPAGIAAAIQLQRYGIRFAMIERHRIGGLLWNANLVENYPGFPSGVSGPRLVALFRKHMTTLGVEALLDEVTSVDVENRHLVARTRSREYTPQVVVVASGTMPRPVPLHVPTELGDRVFSEISPIWSVRGKHVVIVGAGDAALDHALRLLQHNLVTLLHRSQDIQGLPLLWQRARSFAGFNHRAETSVLAIAGSVSGLGLTVLCENHGSESNLSADYVIFALGRQPCLDFLSNRAREQEKRLLERGQLYYVGDVRNGSLRQTAIAAGDGLRAAMQISDARSGR